MKELLEVADRLAPGHTAVLVVDMQNDFCANGGYVDKVIKRDLSACQAVAGPVNELVAAARAAGVPVVWLRADYRRERIPESMRAKLDKQGVTEVCCVPGTWGADWFGVAPAEGEPVVTKSSYSGFHATGMEQTLRGLGARTVVFCGVQTHVCVESTLRDAHSLGFYCVVPQECVASHTPPAHEATLANVRFLFGDVVTLGQVTSRWSQPDARK